MTAWERTSGKAMLSLVLGVLSFAGLLFTGVPALLLGFLGLRDINGSDGQIKGRGLAIAGMTLGGLGILVSAVGMFLWLVLFPLWQKADRLACENNLRRIGQALHHHQEQKQSFPAGTLPNSTLASEKRLSWLVAILPEVGETALYQKINQREAWDAEANRPAARTPVRWFICPAYAGGLPVPGPTYYVGIAGVGARAAMLPSGDANAGIFGYDRQTKLQDVTRGQSETMMVAETQADNGPWAAGGPSSVRGLHPAGPPYLGPNGQFGGLHPAGANILFVDGSVRWIADSIDPDIFEALAKIHAD